MKILLIILYILLLLGGSIISNLYILLIIKLGLVGPSLQYRLSNLLETKISLFYIIPFIICFFILTYLDYTIVFLEDKEVIVTVAKRVVDNGRSVFSGDTLNLIFNNLGSAAVFSGGARIAAGLLALHKMHLLPKAGIIGGVGAGFTLTFKVLSNTFSVPSTGSGSASIETGQVTLQIEGLTINKTQPLWESNNPAENYKKLEKYFGTNNLNNSKLNISENVKNKLEIKGGQEESNSVIEELDNTFPNWKDVFVNSPLENGDLDNSVKQFLIETLTSNLMLQFIILYLLVMFIIIFTCKLLIEKDIPLNKIKEYPLGNYIYYILSKYVSIWRESANFWIYLLGFCLIIFTSGSIYSISNLISFLK